MIITLICRTAFAFGHTSRQLKITCLKGRIIFGLERL